ncbi:ribonuclease P protein component [Natronoglycomyces albus]|uniref:Ribonuclease P protein component n=1 Tax=Natronoglycomyces albus TaxID=2811108 RepID=A0A895XNM2_9ACTN|nr:ribonuclease P protein component [Natronoglycomyces albus]
MLPSAQRIRRRSEFTSVLRGGTRAARGGVVVHWSSRQARSGLLPRTLTETPQTFTGAGHNIDSQPQDPEPGAMRAGFVVSKAVGNAVIRNKVKRRLRHAVMETHSQWPSDVDVVIRATPSASKRTFHQLKDDILAASSAAARKFAARSAAEPSADRNRGRRRGNSAKVRRDQ